MAAHYSTDPLSTRHPNSTIEIPFKVFLRFVPNTDGRRFTKIRDMEKIAAIIEDELLDSGMNLATPVAFTLQFGQHTGRFTVVGFWPKALSRGNAAATSAVNIITDGTVPGERTHAESGDVGGGNLSYGQDVTTSVNNEVVNFIIELKARSATLNSRTEIEFIDYNGIKFGRNAQTFPQ